MSTRRIALGLGLLVFGLYLATSARTRPYGDGEHQALLARRILFEGRVDVPGKPGRFFFAGPDGRTYVPFSLGAALSHAPGVLLTRALATPENRELTAPVLHRVSTSLWGALTAIVFFLLLVELSASRRAAFGAALVLAFATQTWVYAHSHFSENYQAFSLCLAVYATIRAGRRPTAGRAALLGVAWGGLLLAKMVYLALAPLALAYLVARGRSDPRGLARVLGVGLAAFLPLAAVELGYNFVRTGHLLETGRRFDHFDSALDGSLLVGLHGLLFSSGKGIFWFNPVLALAPFGAAAAYRRARPEALFIGGVIAAMIGLHAVYNFWHGAWSWGPRFLTAVVPLMLVPVAFVPWGSLRRPAKVAAALVLAVGVWVQVLGNSFYHAHSVHLNNRARTALLGKSAREGCGWCHENLYPVHFVPHFAPIRVHAWWLETVVTGREVEEAKQTAPWAPYFPEKLNARVPVYVPPVDYWFLTWIAGYERFAAWGWTYLLVAMAIALAGAALLRRRPAAAPTDTTTGPTPARA